MHMHIHECVSNTMWYLWVNSCGPSTPARLSVWHDSLTISLAVFLDIVSVCVIISTPAVVQNVAVIVTVFLFVCLSASMS